MLEITNGNYRYFTVNMNVFSEEVLNELYLLKHTGACSFYLSKYETAFEGFPKICFWITVKTRMCTVYTQVEIQIPLRQQNKVLGEDCVYMRTHLVRRSGWGRSPNFLQRHKVRREHERAGHEPHTHTHTQSKHCITQWCTYTHTHPHTRLSLWPWQCVVALSSNKRQVAGRVCVFWCFHSRRQVKAGVLTPNLIQTNSCRWRVKTGRASPEKTPTCFRFHQSLQSQLLLCVRIKKKNKINK